jgi:hypothetical protein
LGYGRRDVDFVHALTRDGGIHHFNIVLFLLFFVFIFFVYILQIGIRERRPNQRY